jgi:hypothetical protein
VGPHEQIDRYQGDNDAAGKSRLSATHSFVVALGKSLAKFCDFSMQDVTDEPCSAGRSMTFNAPSAHGSLSLA